MKKLLAVITVAVLLFAFAGCKAKNEEPAPQRVYVCGEIDSVVKPSIILMDDNRFQFTFSALSSYIGVGTYSVDGDTLTLKTDDGQYTYTFTKDGDTLVFDAENSSEHLWYSGLTDGSVFE